MKHAEVPTSDTSAHLPVGPAPQKRTVTLDVPHGRSSSVSTDTMLPETPNEDFHSTAMIRRGTHVAVVKLSYFDILKAIFTGAKGLKRKLAAEVKWKDPQEDRIHHLGPKPHPYILDVSVYKSQSSNFLAARCVLDTGNTQGNIISERLVRRLGFTDYAPLRPAEEHGGKVATGHIHEVKGSVRVSWCHVTSPKMFNDMRFLVSESEEFDLVIGAGSIWRENLLPAPNLGLATEYVGVAGEKDEVKIDLGKRISDLETEIRLLRNKIRKAEEGSDRKRGFEQTLKEKEGELEGVKRELGEHNREMAEEALREEVGKGDKGKKEEKKKEKERKEKEKKEKKEREKLEKERKKERSKSKRD